MNDKKIDPIRPTDDEAIALARNLLRTANYAALGTLDPQSGAPHVTRVAMATGTDGTPILLISSLSSHTRALSHDPRCSLLVGEPGKGDPLTHPRITVACKAARTERGSEEQNRLAGRYLRHNPKASLYAGFGDFDYWRLDVENAALNGGFGKAYNLKREEILSLGPFTKTLADQEEEILAELNARGLDSLAEMFSGSMPAKSNWKITGIDPEGIDIARGSSKFRLLFNNILNNPKRLSNLISQP